MRSESPGRTSKPAIVGEVLFCRRVTGLGLFEPREVIIEAVKSLKLNFLLK